MKWIEDLPDDFTQDFRFTVTGVDDPHAWLNDKLKLGLRNWDDVVTLARNEILMSQMICESIISSDVGDASIEWSYWKAHKLEGGIATNGCCVVHDEIRRVSFGGQDITGIPDLSSLPELTSLNLHECRSLTDLSMLSDLKGLTSLDLSVCKALIDVSGLASLTGLTSLNLRWCKSLTDVSVLSGLTSLTSLNVSGFAALTDVFVLSGLSGLTSLNLSDSEALTDVSGLASLTKLTSLDLARCRALTDVSVLSGLTELTSLNLSDSEALTDLSVLSGLSGLTYLNLKDCALQDVSVLSGLTGLTSLNLRRCEALTDLSVLSGLTGLTSLDLSNCVALTDLSVLSCLTGLTSLNLSSCEALTDLSVLSGLTGLTSLDLSHCTFQDVSGLTSMTGMTSLDLGWCDALQDISGLTGMTSLTSLDLSFCEAEDLSVLSSLTSLTSLEMWGCEVLTDLSMMSGLTSLTSLDLSLCRALTDVSGLTGLTSLTSLKLEGCTALTEVSGLSGLTGLISLNLSECPYVDHAGNREAIAKLDALKSLDGIGEPWNTSILWNAARRREGKVDMTALLEKMLELLGSPMSNSRLRADFISGLNVLDGSDEQMEQIHALEWNREEWAQLLVETDNRLDPVGSASPFGVSQKSDDIVLVLDNSRTYFKERGADGGVADIGTGRTGIHHALKGYILSVAEGARWEGHEAVLKEAFGHITSELNKEGVELHPSWEEGVVDLLMALRETGMTQEHDTLFKAVTDQSRQAFDQQLRIQAAEAALDEGRWSDALQHMRDLPSMMEAQLMTRVIPQVVGDEVPEAVLDWMETAADHDLGLLVKNTGMTPAEGLRNRRIREQLFFLSASNASMFRELVGQMFAAFPDDPWVAALMTEANPGSASPPAGVVAAGGIRESLQSETLSSLLGPMVSQQLQTAVEGQSEAELHRLAVALLLEHFGAVTPQFRESILTALQLQNQAE